MDESSGHDAFPLLRETGAHPEIARWRHNVGAPVALDLAGQPAGDVARLLVLSWNLAIGQGRLYELLERLFAGEFGEIPDTRQPLVILAQEAFRSDETVPPLLHSWHHGGKPVLGPREDIVQVAREFGLSLRYSPSMRNGEHRSDRGNAVLATIPLGEAAALKLPFVRQRRVAVTADLPVAGIAVASAHLDTGGQPRPGPRFGRFGAGRTHQARALAKRLADLHGERSIVLGADLNTLLGARDPAFRALLDAGFHAAERRGVWRSTMARPVRLLLDHVLHRSPDRAIGSAAVRRIDDPAAVARIFGSDHHPLLASVELR
ncbi:MAG: endonuclease/exonuclease/phosphatase family protein [Longimicrobiales bacterium]